jgi:hypothetical protein
LAANRIIRALHPVFSRNLTPSDFYCFGKLKNIPKGSSFEDELEFLGTVIGFLSEISLQKHEVVFDEQLIKLD